MKQDQNPPPVLAATDPASHAEPPALDPAAYDWVPVRRNPRSDGWSVVRQRAFVEALADCGSVTEAARTVGMSPSSAYRLRRERGGEAFAAAWDAAIHHATRYLIDIAFDRAIRGSDEPVFDREGRRVGRRFRQNDRLLMFLLRAHMPERYAHAHRSARPTDAPLPEALPPVARAVELMAPIAPAHPELLMEPGALADALRIADLCDGQLPHWIANRDGQTDDLPAADIDRRMIPGNDGSGGNVAGLASDWDDDDC